MSELGPDARRVLDLARDADEPDATDEKRIRASLVQRLGLAGALAAAGLTTTRPASGAEWVAIAGKAVIGVSVGTALIGGWYLAQQGRTPESIPEPAVVVATAPQSSASTVVQPEKRTAPPRQSEAPGPPLAMPSVSARPSVKAVARPRASTVEQSSSPDLLREETASLQKVQAALRSGNPSRALTLIEEQDSRYQSGLLAQERAAARVLGLCELGRKSEARRSARQFEARWPRSPLLARVRGACPK